MVVSVQVTKPVAENKLHENMIKEIRCVCGHTTLNTPDRV